MKLNCLTVLYVFHYIIDFSEITEATSGFSSQQLGQNRNDFDKLDLRFLVNLVEATPELLPKLFEYFAR